MSDMAELAAVVKSVVVMPIGGIVRASWTVLAVLSVPLEGPLEVPLELPLELPLEVPLEVPSEACSCVGPMVSGLFWCREVLLKLSNCAVVENRCKKIDLCKNEGNDLHICCHVAT